MISAARATIESVKKFIAKGTAVISEVVPSINRILKILLPIMLPIAMSQLPFLAAITEVTSSGREVPNATIVSPISTQGTLS